MATVSNEKVAEKSQKVFFPSKSQKVGHREPIQNF